MARFTCPLWTYVCVVIALAACHTVYSASCNSAILQLDKYPDNDIYTYTPTSACYPDNYLTINSMKGLCNVAIKVDVNPSGVIRFVPLSMETVSYVYPGPGTPIPINCKDLNASGIFNAGSTTAATVMLFDDQAGPLTTVNVSTSGRITLTPGHTYGYRSPGPTCPFNFTVVSGCFMGISGTGGATRTCPKGYVVATGRFGLKYCAPCKPGSTSPGGSATKCTLCAAGTYNRNYGGRCRPCEKGYYADKAGATGCDWCSLFDNKNRWTDGKTCMDCPQNSYASTSNPAQCQRCSKGVKCCTVNWGASCPKCTSATQDYSTYTSVFGLSSGSSAACLKTRYALCSPKFNITIDQTCGMLVSGMPPNVPYQSCDWQVTAPIIGNKPNALVDLAKFKDYYWSDSALAAGNVTKVSGPFLDFYLPQAQCTLTYRALSKPAAALLGVPPAVCPEGTKGCTYRPPSSAALCPAGSFIEEETDTKPAPCHPCPPGTYSSKPSAKACLPCKAGYTATGYGNTICTLCPADAPLAGVGAATCQQCDYNAVRTGVNKCTACPANTGRYSYSFPTCLGNNKGNICCALGDCKGQSVCPKPLPEIQWDYNIGAIVQLTSTANLQQSFCSKATLLSCLDPGAYVAITPGGSSFSLQPLMQKRCMIGNDQYRYSLSLYGGFSSAKRGAGSIYNYDPRTNQGTSAGYELLSNAATKTLTIYLSRDDDPINKFAPNLTTCSATFKLVAGYTFDLTPPAGAKCPTNTIPIKQAGRTFCNFCGSSQFKNGTTCSSCPVGTYQAMSGATACETCPAGTSCNWPGTSWPNACYSGFNPTKGGGDCKPCAKNQYPFPSTRATKCMACPRYTVSAPGSAVCGVPWVTKF